MAWSIADGTNVLHVVVRQGAMTVISLLVAISRPVDAARRLVARIRRLVGAR
jgi:hypothetical protein